MEDAYDDKDEYVIMHLDTDGMSYEVGKGLRRLTKHPRKKIQAFPANLIQLWKQIVMEESKGCKKNGRVDYNECAKARENKVKKSSSFWSEAKVRKTELDCNPGSEKMSRSDVFVTEEKPNYHVNKLSPNPAQPPSASMTKCNKLMRNRVQELLFEALSRVSGEASNNIVDGVNACDPSNIAVSLESTMFQNWGRMNGTHKMKYRSIMFNIKDRNNLHFKRKVLLGHVKPERLLEMANDERQLQNQQIKEKALSKCEPGAAPNSTDQFKCSRCGERKCTYYQMRTNQ